MSTRTIRLDRKQELWNRYRSNLPRHLIGLARHLQIGRASCRERVYVLV